jgi:hypothetical protein
MIPGRRGAPRLLLPGMRSRQCPKSTACFGHMGVGPTSFGHTQLDRDPGRDSQLLRTHEGDESYAHTYPFSRERSSLRPFLAKTSRVSSCGVDSKHHATRLASADPGPGPRGSLGPASFRPWCEGHFPVPAKSPVMNDEQLRRHRRQRPALGRLFGTAVLLACVNERSSHGLI